MYKNKDHGMMSAAASLGLILLWDLDGGLTQLDAYLLSQKDYIKAGALMAIGITSTSVRDDDTQPALALLGGRGSVAVVWVGGACLLTAASFPFLSR